jgi:predicted AlkP superfamily phosphohydrolase/phosphomutase
LALTKYEQKNPFTAPKAVNLRRGETIWRHLSDGGVESTILRCPCTFPPDEFRGRMLSGMGIPDVRGGLGTGAFYTTDASVVPLESEQVVHLTPQGDRFETHLIGPRHPKTGGDATAAASLRVDREHRLVTLTVRDAQPASLVLREGEWSGWLRVSFKLGLLQSVRGAVRFYLRRLGPSFELYASPVNFDAQAPLFPISRPAELAAEISTRQGPYYTTGMVEDHAGLSNGRFDESAFLDQCDDVWRERKTMMLEELHRLDEGLFFCLFDTPDRVQHMFWRFREDDHPANRASGETPTKLREYGKVIDDEYRRCDAVLGEVLDAVDDQTLLIALSDHGFGSFRRGVNLNTWLQQQGLLVLKPGVQPGEDTGEFFAGVDWDRSRAYSVGLGGIYLNRQGREGRGVVSDEEAPNLEKQIADQIGGLADPQNGATAVRQAVRRDEVYSGPYVDQAPDLVVHFSRGYRASWSTALGGVSPNLLEDNVRRWGGDHIVHPGDVPGVLFMNQAFHGENPRLLDMAPTIAAALGVPASPAMEGRSLRE